jgi:hypothetical protein
VCWQPLAAHQWLLVPGAALAEHVPPPAGFGSGDGPGMFAFADPDRVRPILAAAGWRDLEITSEHRSILVGGGGSVDDAVWFMRTGSMGRMMLAGADADTADRAVASVRAALAPYADADDVPPDLVQHTAGQFGQVIESSQVTDVLVAEERRFREPVSRGRALLGRLFPSGRLTETDYEFLRDTHGLPRELVTEVLSKLTTG